MGYDQEMVPKSKDWVERLNPDRKLPNFNTGRVLVPESQAVNESFKFNETSNTPKSSKDSKIESLTPLPPLKNLQEASPSLEVMPLTFQPYYPKERPVLEPTTPFVPTEVKDNKQELKINELTKLVQMLIVEKDSLLMICKGEDHRTSDHEIYTASLKRSENYKAQPYQYASPSKNYPECEICRSYDHFTLGHNRVIHIRGGVLVESSQSCKSSIGVKCNTCGSTVHSTTDHNEFDHFKRREKTQALKAMEPTKKWVHKRN
ncbi:hypothetical protein Tco_1303244 [Tanacetum coccineum]